MRAIALQAQLDALNAEYQAADESVQEILDRHLSPEEKAYLDGIEDDEFRAQEEWRIMKEKLERGEIPQTEFDDFADRWNTRQGIGERRKAVREEVSELRNLEGAQKLTNKAGSAAAEAASEGQDEKQQSLMKQAVHQQNKGGNTAAQNDFDNLLGGLAPSGPIKSVASAVSGDAGFSKPAPPVRDQFNTTSGQTDDVKPDAQIELTQKRGIDPANGFG